MPARGPRGPRRSFCGLAVARPRVVPGWFPPASACFSWRRRCFGPPQRFSWQRRCFPKARQPFVMITLDPLSEHFRGLALRGAELPSWRGVAAKRELELIAKPLGLLMKRFSADVVSCAQKLAATLCPCNVLLTVRRSPIFAVRHLLRRSRCVLSCAGVEADSW